MAFRVIQGALSVIVTQIRTLASLASEVDRLHFLLICVESMVPEVSRRGVGSMARLHRVRRRQKSCYLYVRIPAYLSRVHTFLTEVAEWSGVLEQPCRREVPASPCSLLLLECSSQIGSSSQQREAH